MNETADDIGKLTQMVFSTPEGERLLNHMKKAFVDRPIYFDGMTLDQVAYREGQRDIVQQILKELK